MCASDCHRKSEYPLPWEGRDDLIMSNKEYWEECAKVMEGEIDPEIPDDMEVIDGMPASRPRNPDRSRAPWED